MEDDLGNSVALFYLEVFVGVILDKDVYNPPEVGVYGAIVDMDVVFSCQSTSTLNISVHALGYLEYETC